MDKPKIDIITITPEEKGYVATIVKGTDAYYIRGDMKAVLKGIEEKLINLK